MIVTETESKDFFVLKTVLRDIRRDYNNSFISIKADNDEVIIPISECKIKIMSSIYTGTIIQKAVTLEIIRNKLHIKENTDYTRFSFYRDLGEAEFSVNYFVVIRFSYNYENIHGSLALYKGNIILGAVNYDISARVERYYLTLNANKKIKRKVYF